MSITNEKTRFPLISIPPSVSELDFLADLRESFHMDMALIHNVFIRALNNVYYCAPRVRKGDEVAFAGYVLAFTETLHLHHHGEEESLFPFLQRKINMHGNVEQHDGFKEKIKLIDAYMKEVQEYKAEYHAERVREMIETFGDILVEHLHEEIPTISPERMAVFDQDEAASFGHTLEEHIKSFPMFRSHPLILTHHDSKGIPNWPPAPSHVKWMARNVMYWRHKSYWQFSPYTRYGDERDYVEA